VRQDIKQYFVLLIIGLFMVGICFGMCPGNVYAEPECAVFVEPQLPGENRAFEVAQPIRMRSIAGWETASFSASQMNTIVEDAADALVSAQNATDKGWAFNLDTGTTTSDNIYGAVGLGLLRAYNMTKSKSGVDIEAGNPGYLTAAGEVADKIMAGGFDLQATDYIMFCHLKTNGQESL